MPQFNQITPVQLMRLIGTPEAPALLDLRPPEDRSAWRIPTAIPCGLAPPNLAPNARVVVICTRGAKRSEGMAALLRLQGHAAEVLEGGHLAWEAAGLPLTPEAALPASRLWVTRHRPKIDRIVCPWLIRRFVDPGAQFLYVAPTEVAAVADTFGATPFDIEGATFSHRGALCSLDALIADFGLGHPALDRLALVVRAADTDAHDLSPQAAGLLAISVGLSRMYRCDLAQLEAGMGVYDALYRWARDGFDEGHDWPAGRQA
ncbi:chromate resistance protein [Rhodobacter sp. KR11]|uniref:chromate resistance protein ChrB domain-containing protein n=1 Tax=Rhodobacter sp. KR11 TaxID=2974588 RepID=UPI0022226BA4|nr:chromate resistance protein ChrB domain-containing protein [Rhodobacter sp. KR11]MCW1917679.1 chromate resistance protein [Rhodobacter sp. KR11]